jgi:hypothetical protein
MTAADKQFILMAVTKLAATDPSACRPIIDAATDGVKVFADQQSDKTSKFAFKLMTLFCENDVSGWNFGPWTVADYLDELEPHFNGTPAMRKLREKYSKTNDT